ncbi:MAG: hypothetical protein AAF441_13950 [Pseudomonadota bacterium]
MPDKDETKDRLLNALVAFADAARDERTLSQQFRNAFLAHCSETPDNLACMDRVSLRTVTDTTGSTVRGLALSDSEELLVEVAWRLEDLSMPEELKAQFPHLTEEDWDAFTRLTTVLFGLVSCRES